MEYIIYDSSCIKKFNMKPFAKIVYYNFPDLISVPELKHTVDDILETLNKNNVLLLLCYDTKQKTVLGYLLGYNLKLNDGRHVMYISYVYVANRLRSKGVGSKLMNMCEAVADKRQCEGILLTCNTHDKKVMHFYETKGYMLDLELRRYTKHDVMFKVL
uniref:N-alpha-acetyltransferase 40 n=1 Tax=viral metagenome TaxID=1070528 RepID=A0A6C0E8Y2_9ZZZZ